MRSLFYDKFTSQPQAIGNAVRNDLPGNVVHNDFSLRFHFILMKSCLPECIQTNVNTD